MDSKNCGCIDLHIHSTASDGTYTPAELIQMAHRIGLDAISITDHDTLEGTRRALHSDFPSTLRFITGVEISAATPAGSVVKGGIHLLGYGIDPDDTALCRTLKQYTVARARRIDRIVKRLNDLGIDLNMEQVQAEVGDSVAGRPHVASAMIKAGFAVDIDDAFDRYLGNDKPAYVGKERLDCHLAIKLIRDAGGLAVLAHPYLIKHRNTDELRAFVGQLCDIGLQGIEVYYTRHTATDVANFLAIADQFNLLVTGGSDFHGDVTPDIELGHGTGDLHVPTPLYDALQRRCARNVTR